MHNGDTIRHLVCRAQIGVVAHNLIVFVTVLELPLLAADGVVGGFRALDCVQSAALGCLRQV